jgi:hypothetical protein
MRIADLRRIGDHLHDQHLVVAPAGRFVIELFGPAMLADPYAVYAELRGRDPVY